MNMPELVARSRSEYIRIAVRLWADKGFYRGTVAKIESRLSVVWEDMEYAFSWYQLLSRAAGLPSLPWDAYITQTGRDLLHETMMRDTRRANRAAFDAVWGAETWLLDGGVARLEARLESDQSPRVFSDWVSVPHPPSQSKGVSVQKAPSQEVYADIGGNRLSNSSRGGHGDVGALSRMRTLARTWELEESYRVAIALLATGRYLNDPQFLLDVGGVQYFRGEYDSAYHFCNQAAALVPDSILAQQCLGVSGMYLEGREGAALVAFREAVRQQQLRLQRTDGAAAMPDTLTSDVFTFTDESLLINLLSALRGQGLYRECVQLMCEAMNLPMPEKGGKSLLHHYTLAYRRYLTSERSQCIIFRRLCNLLRFHGLVSPQHGGSIFPGAAAVCCRANGAGWGQELSVRDTKDPANIPVHAEPRDVLYTPVSAAGGGRGPP